MKFGYTYDSVTGKHLLRVPEEYKAYCGEQRSRHRIDVLSLAAGAINGPSRYARDRVVTVCTIFTGRHFLQGELPAVNEQMCWLFDEAVACAMETREVVELTPVPYEEIRGWYQCRACGLVAHDPHCPSCSMSCPVCEVMEAERAPNHKQWINSNDHLRFGPVDEFGHIDPSDRTLLDGPMDEVGCEDMSELLRRSEAHGFIAQCAVSVSRMLRGEVDHLASPIVIENFKEGRFKSSRVGVAYWRVKECAELHLSASVRCIDKVRTLLALTGFFTR